MENSRRQLSGLACEECRRRKSKCDRVRPICGGCSESGVECAFVEERPKRGPKKGQLRALRARVATLEQQLADQLDSEVSNVTSNTHVTVGIPLDETDLSMNFDASQTSWVEESELMSENIFTADWQDSALVTHETIASPPQLRQISGEAPAISDFPHLMQVDLDQLYFDRVHPLLPMIHRRRYLSWAGQEAIPPARQCLQFAMRAIAASMSFQFRCHSDRLYLMAKQLLEGLDGSELGLPWTSGEIHLEQTQAWLLLAHYELLTTEKYPLPMTVRRALRLVHLSRLHCSDPNELSKGGSLSKTESLDSSDSDFVATEERRRTFWIAFCLDRFMSGYEESLPTIHEEIVSVRLPCPESNFQNSKDVQMGFLDESPDEDCMNLMSPFAEFILAMALFGRCLVHQRMHGATAAVDRENRAFWVRHDWLAAAAEKQASRLSSLRPLPPEPMSIDDEPMHIIVEMLVHGSVLALASANDGVYWKTEKQQRIATTHRKRAHEAALSMARLAKAVTGSTCFKSHPYLPSLLALAISFLTAHSGMPEYESSANDIESAIALLTGFLESLVEVNGLAQKFLEGFKLWWLPDSIGAGTM
ncbi:hypothetical protein NM208_g13380 [Fusarium decemcellulare]|uniref:Uncharacterized protein n=1 Tax=Fusarium decemcellulare TaxID=57161 RepID=A0ACC1RML6_9HYPO|nr:hypothetical protein NM208_g13380 [Fusarium decemcellulare]